MYYSFFATCKKNNVNPSKWLLHVLENINDTKSSELHNLLPQYFNHNLVD
ncbi:MAG: transposase domain-containing protein [Lutibacter sp.]